MTGSCDCCGKKAPLSRAFYCAIETYACADCRGYPANECQCCGDSTERLFEINGHGRLCGTCADDLADERHQEAMQREWP